MISMPSGPSTAALKHKEGCSKRRSACCEQRFLTEIWKGAFRVGSCLLSDPKHGGRIPYKSTVLTLAAVVLCAMEVEFWLVGVGVPFLIRRQP